MLPVQPRREYRKPGFLLCMISYATWGMGMAALLSAIVFPECALWFSLPIFFSVLFQGFALNAFGKQDDGDDENVPKFETILFWSQIVVGPLAFLCFAALLLIGGGPEMVDGNHCIVSHGEVIRYITPAFYRLMQTVENGFMAGLLYIFSAQMLLICRKRRRRG